MNKALCFLLLLLPCGCGKVLGYYPTEEELAAIQRGEDPRANEGSAPAREKVSDDKRERDASGGLESGSGKGKSSGAGEITSESGGESGPSSGTVLRWVDCGLVIVEAEGKRERVRMPGMEVPRDFTEAQQALDQARTDFPTGTKLALTYPQKTADGKSAVYRNADGDLLANIRKTP